MVVCELCIASFFRASMHWNQHASVDTHETAGGYRYLRVRMANQVKCMVYLVEIGSRPPKISTWHSDRNAALCSSITSTH